jgi:hypothetical protein
MNDAEMSEKMGEVSDDAVHKMEEFLEHLKNGLSVTNRRFADRYVRRELWLRVHVRMLGKSGNPVDFCAVFHNRLIPSGQRDDGQPNVDLLRMLMADEGSEVERHDRAKTTNRYQQPVLVDNVQLMKSPEVFISSLVWFGLVDEVYRSAAHSLYFSRAMGFVFLDVIKDRITRIPVGRCPVCENQLIGEMVKAAPQIVDDVADGGGDFQWNFRDFANPEHPVSRLRIILEDDLVWVGLKEGVKASVEITDVLIGPFGFDQQSQQPL